MHVYAIAATGKGPHAIVLNVDEAWIQERVVGPWERGEDMVLSGQHWNPRASRVVIMATPNVVEGVGMHGWEQAVKRGWLVTDQILQRPAGSPDAVAQFAEDRRKVMVVHGRNLAARNAMFEFLRAIDLRPLEWTEVVGSVNVGAPYIGDVLDAAFAAAQAAVILATPDDLAGLRPDLLQDGDPDNEGEIRGQPRPNVFIEAGMALARQPTRTIFAELGGCAPSDLAGRFAVKLDQGPQCRRDLAQRLDNAGCLVNTEDPLAHRGRLRPADRRGGDGRCASSCCLARRH